MIRKILYRRKIIAIIIMLKTTTITTATTTTIKVEAATAKKVLYCILQRYCIISI